MSFDLTEHARCESERLTGEARLERRPLDPVLLHPDELGVVEGPRLLPELVHVGAHCSATFSPLEGRMVIIAHHRGAHRLAERVAADAPGASVTVGPDLGGWRPGLPVPRGADLLELRRRLLAALGGGAGGVDLDVLEPAQGDAPRLPSEALGEDLGRLAEQVALASGAPADYAAVALLGLVAGFGPGAHETEAASGWVEPVLLWSALIGQPGSGKSAAIKPVDAALAAVEAGAAARQKLRRAAGDEDARLDLCRLDDLTPEAGAIALAAQRRGLLAWAPEMASWIAAQTRYRSDSRGLWLRSWATGGERRPTLANRPRERLARTLARWIAFSGATVLDTVDLRRRVRLPGLRDEVRICAALRELAALGWLAEPSALPRRDHDPLPRVVEIKPEVVSAIKTRLNSS